MMWLTLKFMLVTSLSVIILQRAQIHFFSDAAAFLCNGHVLFCGIPRGPCLNINKVGLTTINIIFALTAINIIFVRVTTVRAIKLKILLQNRFMLGTSYKTKQPQGNAKSKCDLKFFFVLTLLFLCCAVVGTFLGSGREETYISLYQNLCFFPVATYVILEFEFNWLALLHNLYRGPLSSKKILG
ncbi:hypothetical protein ACJX0J_021558 [Zea mays]